MALMLPTVSPHTRNSDELEYIGEHIEQQNHIADHLLGMVARRDGKPLDQSKSAAWQRGWSVMSRSKSAG
jgi:hypothetical protein